MSAVDRICADATTPQLCTRMDHEGFKVNADTFAAATTFIGVGVDGLIFANCRLCPSTLFFDPDEWRDEPTEVMSNAIARPL